MAKESKRKTGGKKKKDPSAPKRPLSAYMFFANAKRKELMAENPKKTVGELGKELGALWKNLSEDDKKPYAKQAVKDKSRYEEEMKSYQPPEPESGADSDTEKKGKKRKKDPNAPKRALSAYMLFCNDKRAEVKEENPNIENKEIMKVLAERWKELSGEDKKEFDEKANEEKERYKKAMEKYKQSGGGAKEKPKEKAKPAAKKAAAKPPAKKAKKTKGDESEQEESESSSSASSSDESESGSESEGSDSD